MSVLNLFRHCLGISSAPEEDPEDVPPMSTSPMLKWYVQKGHRFGALSAGEARDYGDADYQTTVEFLVNKTFRLADGNLNQNPVQFPANTLHVSVAADNFRVGRAPTDFIPTRGNFDGTLSFQKISKNVTATYYNVLGVQYLAGLSYDLSSGGKSPLQNSHDITSFELTWLLRRRFPDENVIHNEPWYGRDCQLSRQRVLVGCDNAHQILLHFYWDWSAGRFRTVFCEECEQHTMDTTSTVVAAKLGFHLRHLTPEPNSPPNSPTPTDSLDCSSSDSRLSFGQLETDEAEEE